MSQYTKYLESIEKRVSNIITEDMVLDSEQITDLYKKVIIKMQKQFKDADWLLGAYDDMITDICDWAWNTVYEKHGLSNIYVPVGMKENV